MAAYFTYIYIYIYILPKKKKLYIYNYVIVSGSGCTDNPSAKPDNWITRVKLVPGLHEFKVKTHKQKFLNIYRKSILNQPVFPISWSPTHSHAHKLSPIYNKQFNGDSNWSHIISALFCTTTLKRASYHLWLRYCQFSWGGKTNFVPERKN